MPRSLFAILALLALDALPLVAQADTDEYSQYNKLDTPAGWVEFLSSPRSDQDTAKAERALAKSIARLPSTKIQLGTMKVVECAGGSVSQTDLIRNLRTVGPKWGWYCEKGSFRYSISNPTNATLFVRGRAHDIPFDLVISPGEVSTGNLSMDSSCSGRDRQQGWRFARGKIIITCGSDIGLQVASILYGEARDLRRLLQRRDQRALEDFARSHPSSRAMPYVESALSAMGHQRARSLREHVKAQLRTSTALGPAPTRLIDRRPYVLTLTNPTDIAIVAVLQHEDESHQEVPVPAGGSTSLELLAHPTEPPAYSVVDVQLDGDARSPLAPAVLADSPPTDGGMPPSAVAKDTPSERRTSLPSSQLLREGDRFEGSYHCGQGNTSLTLSIETVSESGNVSAIFAFDFQGSRRSRAAQGSFAMSGVLDVPTRTIRLQPGKWIQRPAGYITVGLKGVIAIDGATIQGRISGSGCSGFQVTRRVREN